MTEEQSSPTERSTPSFSTRRARLFGLDSDQLIKGFFGINATVAIVVLALITIFLFKEGAGFIGKYRNSLEVYRLSGLEYVDILKKEREAYTELTRYLNGIRADWIKQLKAQGLSQDDINKTVMSESAKDFFFGYMRVGSDMRRFVQEKMMTAIEIRDQYITNENLRDSIDNLNERIKDLTNRNYNITPENRAEFALRLKDAASEGDLSREEARGYLELADSIPQGIKLTHEDRELYMHLLERDVEDTKRNIQPIDFAVMVKQVTSEQDKFKEINDAMAESINAVMAKADAVNIDDPALREKLDTFVKLNKQFIKKIPEYESQLADWSPDASVSSLRAITAFLAGKDWITASDQQDWYGLLPLLTGSLLISFIALLFAVPFGVGAAIYANQIAGPKERNLIKPYIEFIEAIPSVVIGFFGVMVLGEAIRDLSQMEFMSWVPFFPIQERLNAFTAGVLLALMAIPTIFTLSEDAINNIPRHFKEASFAMGATRLQTTLRVIVPTALSGIISAVMLGFGRVVGETMVVLLCAGNRIKIPDFTEGLGVFFEPVHTMTGIIAQEMGEVVHGSLHYRALFMVGIVLFFLSLIINIGAQWVVKKFRKIGD